MNDHFSVIGKNAPRIDAIDKVTGGAKYAPDLSLRGMLHGALLRSPYPHAKVVGIDATKAKNLHGLRAIVTIDELPRVVGYWFLLRSEKKEKEMFLRDNVVRFIGDPVVAVAADDQEIALEAVSMIEVIYEPLQSIFDPHEALNNGEVRIHEKGNTAFHVTKHYGDIEQGFREAECVIENRFVTSKQKHAPLEPIGTCIAEYNAAGKLTVYTSTQLPNWSQMYLAKALGLPNNRVRIIKPYTGGAFGGRCGLIHGLEVMCAFLSKRTGKPVRLSFSRSEDFMGTETRHPMTIDIKTGVTKEGRLTANSIKILANVGGYSTHTIGVLANCLSTGVGLYRCPNVYFDATAVYTNQSLTGAFRGYGNPQMNFAQESQMDIIARDLGIDPVELRLKNYRGLGEIDPIFVDEIRSDGLKECLKKGAEALGWKDRESRQKPQGPRKRGVGMAIMLHGTGAAGALPDPASAAVMISSDGSVHLVTAASDEGQGNRTALAQIAAEELGVRFDQISVSMPDTDVTPLDGGTHGSRQTYAGGLAAKKAAADAKKKLLDFATKHLGAPKDELCIKEGIIFNVRNPSVSVKIGDLMRKIQIGDMSICEQIIGVSTGVAPAMPGYYGATFVEVEVDTETGEVRVVRVVGAFDVGKAINPANIEGQITGGAVMGIGWTLTEELLLKEGRVLNDSFRDYRILRACDVGEIVPIIVESYEPTGPFGAKGVGEGTMVGVAPAVANAIYDAIGVRMKELCITPEKIFEALDRIGVAENSSLWK
jgi:xanthine dehydrogenase molybdenum-binding subunit